MSTLYALVLNTMLSLVVFLYFSGVNSQDISPLVDVKVLSELPLDKLLQVKESFIDKNDLEVVVVDHPEALALHGPKKHMYAHDHHDHHHIEKEHFKKTDNKSVQSIFQLSVTTLAFLAFGGYLLCLLVHAIRGKTMNMTTVAPTIMAAIIRRPAIRRRTTRRPTKYIKPIRRRPKRDILLDDLDSEKMYYSLVHLAEAYTMHHTTDYAKFNYSSSTYA